MLYPITDFGADTEILNNAAAIQRAVDAASAAGGGTVIVPAGRFVSGMILLRDNVTFQLEPGAELFASTDPDDYDLGTGRTDCRYRDENGNGLHTILAALLCCRNVKNVVIRGGRLFSDDEAFWTDKHTPGTDYEPAVGAEAWYYYEPKPFRMAMITCEECDNITVENVRIDSYPVYAGWFLGCSRMTFRSLDICGRQNGLNTDGLHFSSCRNVRITDCNFVCGDDCVAIDGNHHGPGCDFTVANCHFDTSVHAVRIYSGLDPKMRETGIKSEVHRVTITNCTVAEAAGVFDINADGGELTDIIASNIVAHQSREGALFMISSQKGGTIRRVSFSGITADTNGCGMIWASHRGEITGVRIADATLSVTPKTKLQAQPALKNEYFPNHCHFKPNHFYFYNAEDVTVRDVTVRWNAPLYSDTWKADRVQRLEKLIAPLSVSDLEPRHLKAFELVDCASVRLLDNDAPDFSC